MEKLTFGGLIFEPTGEDRFVFPDEFYLNEASMMKYRSKESRPTIHKYKILRFLRKARK